MSDVHIPVNVIFPVLYNLKKLTNFLYFRVGIDILRIFILYNIDFSLKVQYLNNIYNDAACLPGT